MIMTSADDGGNAVIRGWRLEENARPSNRWWYRAINTVISASAEADRTGFAPASKLIYYFSREGEARIDKRRTHCHDIDCGLDEI